VTVARDRASQRGLYGKDDLYESPTPSHRPTYWLVGRKGKGASVMCPSGYAKG